ncbi:MAG TPA: transglutaminase domain-containing protein [Fimbriimonas sp.]|nr:transglutaminase domain-containing protein [Fimbriimonas sp.]
MKGTWWSDTSRANWVDYAISLTASLVATFAVGQAVRETPVSLFGMAGVALGTLFSFGMRSLFVDKKFLRIDGILYALVAWMAFGLALPLNAMVFAPDTFPIEIRPASWLMWMAIFGSFLMWRDGTLLFQCIAPLAIFGIVGCYDTFREAPFFFFVFLICFAMLFARAHARDMQQKARESGYFSKDGTNVMVDPQTQSQILREGPWRWAAGTEWALGSALIIVVLSVIGAPVIRETAKPISGIISTRTPRLRNNNTIIRTPMGPGRSAMISQGPVELSDKPFYEVTGDVPEYMRLGTFNALAGRAWINGSPGGLRRGFNRATGVQIMTLSSEQQQKLMYPNLKVGQFLDEYRSKTATIKTLMPSREVLSAGNGPIMDGGLVTFDAGPVPTIPNPSDYSMKLKYDVVPTPTEKDPAPVIVNDSLVRNLEVPKTTQRVLNKVTELTKDAKSDLEKANRIREFIAKTIKYNTKVDVVPDDQDPIDYTLFILKEGYCDVFATAMVTMARAAGIPARYTVGYLPDPNNRSSQGTQVILESDRHAWAELYFENVGWATFDATEGAEVVPGGGRHDNQPRDPKEFFQVVGKVLNVLIVVCLIGGLYAIMKMIFAPKTPEMVMAELNRQYVRFTNAIWRRTRVRRLLSETTDEYLVRATSGMGPHAEQAKNIGDMFTARFFGREPAKEEDLKELGSVVDTFVKQLREKGPKN